MKHDPVSISQKIRNLRKQNHLTQSELAGNQITRNMMCRIESGSATPSRATLAYFAERLNVPLLYFLDENLTLTDCLKQIYLEEIQSKINEKHYKDALNLIQKIFKDQDDELSYLAAYCVTQIAKKALHDGNLDTTMKLIQKAYQFIEGTVYPTEHIRASLILLHAVAVNVQSPRYEIDESTYIDCRNDSVMQNFYAYLIEDNASCNDPLYTKHLEARKKIRNHDYTNALLILQNLEDKRTSENLSAVFLFRIYTDIETCYRELNDYQNAYRYSGKRMTMLTSFKS